MKIIVNSLGPQSPHPMTIKQIYVSEFQKSLFAERGGSEFGLQAIVYQ